MTMDLNGKIVLVTGGSGLIGKSIINEIKNADGVAINLDRNVETDLTNHTINCDITDVQSITNALNSALEKYGYITGLVNNAYPRTKDWNSDFEYISEKSMIDNINWQLTSYMLFCQKAIQKCTRLESIINMASIYGVVANDFNLYKDLNMYPPAAYTSIKGGIINFSRYLASKYGERGLRVNTISPGGVFDHQEYEFVNRYCERVPLKRMADPEDISPSVVFLLSEKSKYITGHNLIIDGGWTAI